ncbi:hypothetical protein EV426DRAFT_710847 [Tirmania nivea]|nr:hypothetical protein EV426DRAFT_710847 [Tirmania nivea]
MTGSSTWSWIWIVVILAICTFVGIALAVLDLLTGLSIWPWHRPRHIPSGVTLVHGPSYLDHDEEEAPMDAELWGTLHHLPGACPLNPPGFPGGRHATLKHSPAESVASSSSASNETAHVARRRGGRRIQLRVVRRQPSTPAANWLGREWVKGKGKTRERACRRCRMGSRGRRRWDLFGIYTRMSRPATSVGPASTEELPDPQSVRPLETVPLDLSRVWGSTTFAEIPYCYALALTLIIVIPVAVVVSAGVVFCIVGTFLRARHQQRHQQIWLRNTTFHPDLRVLNGHDIELQPVPYPQYLPREFTRTSGAAGGSDAVQQSRNEALLKLEGVHVKPVRGDTESWLDSLVVGNRHTCTPQADGDTRGRPGPQRFNEWNSPGAVVQEKPVIGPDGASPADRPLA